MPPVKGKMLMYSEKQMEDALLEVNRGVPVATAARHHNVPRVTLLYKARGKTPAHRKMGPDTVLSKEEELVLIQWITTAAKAGFPVSKALVLDSVQQLIRELNRKTCFINERPGRTWMKGFLKRNPSVTVRLAENLTVTRGSITRETLLKWYDEVYGYMKAHNYDEILNDPRRVFNGDETAFFLSPKGNKVLAAKGDKNVYLQVNPDEKECLTVLITANAEGFVAPPLVVFKYERIPQYLAESVPKGWGIGKSETGWMNSALFYEFITNIFHPWLVENQVPLPVVFFIDGHTSHLTLHTSRFCNANGIILVALAPNATHLIQPMDVAVFRSLKEHWKNKVHQWRLKNTENPTLQKKDFCRLLDEVIKETVTPSMVTNGFRKCGIIPWDPNAVSVGEVSRHGNVDENCMPISQCSNIDMLKTGLQVLEEHIGQDKLQLFKSSVNVWSGCLEDKSLYEVWKHITTSLHSFRAEENISTKNTQNLQENCNITERRPCELDNISAVNRPDQENTKCKGNSSCITPPKRTDCTRPNIPSPFKTVLFWPDKVKANKKKGRREHIPSVVSSNAWQEYYENKLKKKLQDEENKKKRAEDRLKKKQEREEIKRKKLEERKAKSKIVTEKKTKKKRKKPLISSSSEEEDEWRPSGSSIDDVSLIMSDVEDNSFHDDFDNTVLDIRENICQELEIKCLNGKEVLVENKNIGLFEEHLPTVDTSQKIRTPAENNVQEFADRERENVEQEHGSSSITKTDMDLDVGDFVIAAFIVKKN